MEAERTAREAARAAERDVAERLWRRRVRRAFLGWCGWYVLGAAIAFSALNATGEVHGQLRLWLGLAVGNIGAWLHLMFFTIAATERGDL